MPRFQPGKDFIGIFIRREDGIENLGDLAAFDDPRHAFHQALPVIFKGGEPEGVDQFEFGVAQDFKGQVDALDEFFLIFGALGAGAKNLEAKRLEFLVQIAEAAGVRGATAGAGDDVPLLGNVFTGLRIARIEEDDRGGVEIAQIDCSAAGAWQRDMRQSAAGKMAASAIILRHRQRGW